MKKTVSDGSGAICDKSRVLIVDDEETIVTMFQMILSSALPDRMIDSVRNGAEALDAFSRRDYAVLLMDLYMPVMDGQTAFRKIEKLCKKRNQKMPSFVFCTGFAPSEMVRRIVTDDSGHCLLRKPVSPETLVEAVKSRLQ